MDLPNGTYIDHRKVTQLLDVGNNLPFSTAHSFDFTMVYNDVSEHHSGNKYIHNEDHIILMKSSKTLIYANFQ